jgi:hypothetical protein
MTGSGMGVDSEGLACPDCTILIANGDWPDDADRPCPEIPAWTCLADPHGLDRARCDFCGFVGLADYHTTVTLAPNRNRVDR